jgi:hypothetical protein
MENIGYMSSGVYNTGLGFLIGGIVMVGLLGLQSEGMDEPNLLYIIIAVIACVGGFLVGSYWGLYNQLKTDSNTKLYESIISLMFVFVVLLGLAIYFNNNFTIVLLVLSSISAIAAFFMGIPIRNQFKTGVDLQFYDSIWITTGVVGFLLLLTTGYLIVYGSGDRTFNISKKSRKSPLSHSDLHALSRELESSRLEVEKLRQETSKSRTPKSKRIVLEI